MTLSHNLYYLLFVASLQIIIFEKVRLQLGDISFASEKVVAFSNL